MGLLNLRSINSLANWCNWLCFLALVWLTPTWMMTTLVDGASSSSSTTISSISSTGTSMMTSSATYPLSSSSLIASSMSSPSSSLLISSSSTRKINKNPIGQLVHYVQTSVTNTVNGCQQLWVNYGKCQLIRQKMQIHRGEVRLQWEQEGKFQLPLSTTSTSTTSSNKNNNNKNQQQTIKAYQKELQKQLKRIQGGISMEEYRFLQLGKDDRSKLMNFMFLLWGAPRFIPYMLLFNPDMLPSPFRTQQQDPMLVLQILNQSRDRTATLLHTLVQLERQVLQSLSAAAAGSSTTSTGNNLLANLNIFQNKQQQQRRQWMLEQIWYQAIQQAQEPYQQSSSSMQAMTDSATTTGMAYASNNNILPTITSSTSATPITTIMAKSTSSMSAATAAATSTRQRISHILQQMDEYLIRPDKDYTRGERRLCHIPPSIVRGLGLALTDSTKNSNIMPGNGIIQMIQPNFIHRNRLLSYIQKITQADDFLIEAQIDIHSILPQTLQEICDERMIGGPSRTTSELQNALQDWLYLVAHEPSIRIYQHGQQYQNMIQAQEQQQPENDDHLDVETTKSTKQSVSTTADRKYYYNGNLARLVVMGYYGCLGIRDPRNGSTIPRLLFSSSSSSTYSTSVSSVSISTSIPSLMTLADAESMKSTTLATLPKQNE